MDSVMKGQMGTMLPLRIFGLEPPLAYGTLRYEKSTQRFLACVKMLAELALLALRVAGKWPLRYYSE